MSRNYLPLFGSFLSLSNLGGAKVLLNRAEKHEQAEDTDYCENDLDGEDAGVSSSTLGIDHGAVPGVDEYVRHEANYREQASCGTEDSHRNLYLGQRRRANGECTVGGEAEENNQSGCNECAFGGLREHDEADKYRNREDKRTDDGLRGALDLRSDKANYRASKETNTIGADEAYNVNEVTVSAEALGRSGYDHLPWCCYCNPGRCLLLPDP